VPVLRGFAAVNVRCSDSKSQVPNILHKAQTRSRTELIHLALPPLIEQIEKHSTAAAG